MVMHLCAGMGKGQHHMPTKEELVQHYNRVNTVLQVLTLSVEIGLIRMYYRCIL